MKAKIMNQKRTITRIMIVAIAALLVAGLFCGGAMASPIASESHVDTYTLSADETWDYSGTPNYKLGGVSAATGSGCGGMANTLNLDNHTLTIKNLHVTGIKSGNVIQSTAYGVGGLFGRIESAGTLILEDCSISGIAIGNDGSSAYGVSGFLGRLMESGLTVEMRNCTLDNCIIKSSQNSISAFIGIAGKGKFTLINCRVENCIIEASTGTGSNIGGLIGNLYESPRINIDGCVVKGCNILGNSYNIGGFIGSQTGTVNVVNSILDGCEVYSSNNNVGGVFGNVNGGNVIIDGCMINGNNIHTAGVQVGGFIGYLGPWASSLGLNNSVVQDSVICSAKGCVGGLSGTCKTYGSGAFRYFINNTVRNSLIYSESYTLSSDTPTNVGGVYGADLGGAGSVECSSNIIEYCTIVNAASNPTHPNYQSAGGIAGSFISTGILSANKVYNTCVVSVNGAAAGICPLAV